MEQQPKAVPVAPHLRARAKSAAPAKPPVAAPLPVAPHQRAKAKAAQSTEQASPTATTNAVVTAEQPAAFPIAPHRRPKKTTLPSIETAKGDSNPTASAKASISLRDSAIDVLKSAIIPSPTSIREKLSAFGVIAGEAAPANLRDPRNDWPTANGSTRWQARALANFRAPTPARGGNLSDSAPRNDAAPTCYNCGVAGHLAWGCPIRSTKTRAKAAQTTSHSRAPRESRWAKKIPAGDPGRWDSDWNVDSWASPTAAKDANKKHIGDHDSCGWTVDSHNANAGWEERKAGPRAPAGAPGYDLVGFDGDWAPAPLDWDSCPGFYDVEKVARMDSWIDETEKEIPSHRTDARGVMRRHLQDGGERDFVPPYWVPVKFGGTKGWVSPKVFFQEILSNNPPRPVHPGDLENVKPWWDLLDRSREPCLRAIDGPLILGIDPDETTEDRLARENDHGSNHHATNRINAEWARAEAKKSKQARVQQRREALLAAAAAAGPEPNCHNPRPIKSEVNGLYIRSAKPADMLRAKDIYNHHVNSTCCTPENGGIHDDDMIRRYHGVHAEGYPFIVACEKGAKIPPRRSGKDRHGNPDAIALPDKIIGFACADHHHHPLGQFTSTSQLQVFVHRDYLMKGVGSCLMDKMLTLLDPTHVGRGEYEVVGADMDGMGAKTRVRNLILDFPFDRPQTLEWFGRWMRGMGFAQAGMLVDVGVTGTRRVSVAIFQRSTELDVDPAHPPPTSTGLAW